MARTQMAVGRMTTSSAAEAAWSESMERSPARRQCSSAIVAMHPRDHTASSQRPSKVSQKSTRSSGDARACASVAASAFAL